MLILRKGNYRWMLEFERDIQAPRHEEWFGKSNKNVIGDGSNELNALEVAWGLK
jgi:hypothetical protein